MQCRRDARWAGSIGASLLGALAALTLSFLPACNGAGGGGGGGGGGETSDVTFGATFGTPDELVGMVKYKVRGSSRELEVDVQRATLGARMPVLLAGIEVGEVRVGLEGEGEETVTSFPDGTPVPGVGTVVRVGDFEVTLRSLRKLQDLTAEFGGGPTAVEASYKAERLDETLIRELEVDVEGEPGSTHGVVVGGFDLGSVTLDEEGEAELVYSDVAGPLLPAGFPSIEAGARIRVGTLEGSFAEK